MAYGELAASKFIDGSGNVVYALAGLAWTTADTPITSEWLSAYADYLGYSSASEIIVTTGWERAPSYYSVEQIYSTRFDYSTIPPRIASFYIEGVTDVDQNVFFDNDPSVPWTYESLQGLAEWGPDYQFFLLDLEAWMAALVEGYGPSASSLGLWVKSGGTWQQAKEEWIKVNGAWQQVKEHWVKVNGVWQKGSG